MEGEEIPEIGSSSINNNKASPSSLHVLVVDDDPTCLRLVETMLRISEYEVVAAQQAMDALNLLRETERRFDLVLTDVHMPEMDGFELLDHIGREFKIPVIMMSIDDKQKVIAQGLRSGACFYILKPVTLKDIQNLWQHVFHKNDDMLEKEQTGSVHEASSLEKIMREDIASASYVNEQEGNEEMPKESDQEEEDGDGKDDSSSRKKARVVWSSDLHRQFLEAVYKLGLDKAVPKKILEMMNVPGISRENVASHLQKYRLYVKRLKEASRNKEPEPSRCLTNGLLNPSFPPDHPSLMFNSRPEFSQFPNRQSSWMSFQQGIRGNSQGPYFLNQEVPNSNSSAPLRSEQLFSMNNQENIQHPWIGNASFPNQPNFSSSSTLGMELYGNRLSAPFYGNNSTNYGSSSNDTMQMAYQQTQDRPFNQNFSNLPLQNQNNISVGGTMMVRNMGSFENFNQGQGSNYSSNNHTGIQMSSLVGLGGLNHTRPIGGDSLNGVNVNYNLTDEIHRSNMNVPTAVGFNGMNSSYTTQGMESSSGFLNANQFSTAFTNLAVQQEQPQQLRPPPSVQEQQHGGDDIDNFLDMLRGAGTSTNEHNYLPELH